MNPPEQYAVDYHVDHVFLGGEADSVLSLLVLYDDWVVDPRVNRDGWLPWLDRFASATDYGVDHPDTLTTRNNIAAWTGEIGDPQTALKLFEELLPDQMRVLGPDHPDTLTTHNNIAVLTGEIGDPQTALELFEELLPDYMRVLGRDQADSPTPRNEGRNRNGPRSGDPHFLRV